MRKLFQLLLLQEAVGYEMDEEYTYYYREEANDYFRKTGRTDLLGNELITLCDNQICS